MPVEVKTASLPFVRDLSRADANDWGEIYRALAFLAWAHHRNKRRRMTGRELCGLFSDNWRKGHHRAMSGPYNSMRWSFELMDREAKNALSGD